MAQKHGLVKIEEQTGNLPQYKWYVECECGFQARLPHEANVKSQFDAHLTYHGQPVYFATLPTELMVKDGVDPQPVEKEEWKPAGV